MSRNSTSQSQQGIALVSVLAVTVVTVILAAIFSYMVISERRSTNAATVSSSSLQLADAASERARAIIIDKYDKSFLSSDRFIEELSGATNTTTLANDLNNGAALPLSFGDLGGLEANWRYVVPDVDPSSNTTGATFSTAPKWLDIYASAKTGEGVQTVVRRINMGQSDVFTLAMLSENTECIYCHLRVFGDVGSLGFLRPGFGLEGSEEGVNSGGEGGASVVHGDLFVAPPPADAETTDNLSKDGSPGTVNGAVFEGDTNTGYTGSRLPRDSDGNPDFPVIGRQLAERSANGSVSGGIIKTVAENGNLTEKPTTTTSGVTGANDGNVVLIGTEENPIVLGGDVYFSGDVVIKGFVKGKGGVYAGRNVYVAGDIRYVDEPEDCRIQLTEGGNPDTCAQESIGDDSTELRLAARGNIVMGDYTETDGGEPKKSYQAQNAVDYFREQFGFNNETEGAEFYYDKTNGDELKKVAGDGYENIEGKPIDVGNVETVSAEAAYDYSLRPGRVSSSGFDSWLPDDVYQDILGTQVRTFDTWRKNVTRAELADAYERAGSGADGVAAIKELLGPGAKDVSDESITRLACPDKDCPENEGFNLKDSEGNDIGFVRLTDDDGPNKNIRSMRVTLDQAARYTAQTNRVDAFLYANQRIAGKTFNAPLAINGGMVAKEIGVLAPGAQKQWWQDASRYEELLGGTEKNCNDPNSAIFQALAPNVDPDSDPPNAPLSPNDDGYYDLGASAEYNYVEDCALTVNYDYRMRNGGLGFNLVAQDVGRTVGWRVGSNRADRVGF